MSESRWKHWSSGSKDKKLGFSVFMEGRAADEAKEQGLVADYYGRWMDPKTGEVVAKTVNDRLEYIEQGGGDPQPDMGNPTNAASGMKPADRARSLGLQSDGSGGYVDPNTGEVAARTVNNELVFYDGRGGGGAVSDGGGGQAMVQSAPSWRDPVSGIIIVPPAKPETPYETAAVPDPVPATAPMGFDSFLDKKRKEMYASEAESNPYDDFSSMLGGKLDKARGSGDEAKVGAADAAEELMSEIGDELSELMGSVGDDNREEFEAGLLSQIIRAARNRYNESIGSDERELESFSDPLRYARGEAEKNAPVIEQESFEDATGGDPVEGEYTSWEVEGGGEMDVNPLDEFQFIENDVEALQDPEIRKANRGYRGERLTVDWYVKDDITGKRTGFSLPGPSDESGVSNAAVSMDAFKTWRSEILPKIPVGSTIDAYVDMNDESLKRVYKLAGFGTPDASRSMELQGVVLMDTTGKKKVYPVIDTNDEPYWDGAAYRSRQTGKELERDEKGEPIIEEMYIALLDTNLNTEEELMVAEILFG